MRTPSTPSTDHYSEVQTTKNPYCRSETTPIIQGSSIEALNLPQKFYRKKVRLSERDPHQTVSQIDLGPDGPSLSLKAIELDGPAPCCRSKIIGLVVSTGCFNPFRTEVWDHHPGVEHQCLKQSTKYHQSLYRF